MHAQTHHKCAHVNPHNDTRRHEHTLDTENKLMPAA